MTMECFLSYAQLQVALLQVAIALFRVLDMSNR